VNASLELERLPVGPLGVVSQSGSLIGALLSRGAARGIGFSRLVSVGNESDLSVGELMELLVDDAQTGAILPSSHETSSATDCLSGRFAPAGGMRPPRSLRMAASHISASAAMLSGDIASNARPPDLILLLWQPKQFCSITPHGLGLTACGATVAAPTTVAQTPSKAKPILRLTKLISRVPARR
jgi:hypothetical protein